MHRKIKALKNKISNIDWILKGTLLKKYTQCGKNNCRCHQDKKYWHGTYWIWTRKEKGKTITKTLIVQPLKGQISVEKTIIAEKE